MELSKRNLIIVGGIILVLILGIILLGKKPTKKVVTNQNPTGKDFNVVENKEEVVMFNTPTPTPLVILTPTKTPSSTPTLTPTLTPTPTIKVIPTNQPTRIPTATPTPDNSIKATGVSLNVTELNLRVNQSFQILSRVEPNNTTDKLLNWSSSDGRVVIVDNDGKVTTKSTGNSIITAKTSNGKTTIVKVNVSDNPDPTTTPVVKVSIYPENINLNYETVELIVGQREQLRLNINPIDVTDFSTTWSSSNGNVAVVSIWGMVTTKSPGTATITARTINGLTDTAIITVIEASSFTEIHPTKLTITPSKVSIKLKKTYKISAKIEPVNATNKKIIWSSKNTSIATVNSQGVVTGKKIGKTTITAKTANGLSKSSTITIIK